MKKRITAIFIIVFVILSASVTVFAEPTRPIHHGAPICTEEAAK